MTVSTTVRGITYAASSVEERSGRPQLRHGRRLLRGLCDYTSVLEPLASTSADGITTGGLSPNPPVAERLVRISDSTRTGILAGGTAGLALEGFVSGGPPVEGVLERGIIQDGASQRESHRRAFSSIWSNEYHRE